MQHKLPNSNVTLPADRGTCERLWSAIELVIFIQRWRAWVCQARHHFIGVARCDVCVAV